MALRTRPNQFDLSGSRVQTEQISAASRLVSYLTGFVVQPNKAIVGRNAFAHESGIHQDGVLKNPLTYEIALAGNRLSVGKLSGRRGLQGKLAELGYDLDGEGLDGVYRAAIALADAKKEVTDADLVALVEQQVADPQRTGTSVRLDGWSVTSSHGGRSRGSVRLTIEGEAHSAEADGNGPVDALFSAVDAAVEPVLGWHPVLDDYEVRSVSGGEDAQGHATVRCHGSDAEGSDAAAWTVTGHGLATNVIEASLQAYVAAVNRLAAGRPVVSPSAAGERLP
jgi:2-isopropylmalate synthase